LFHASRPLYSGEAPSEGTQSDPVEKVKEAENTSVEMSSVNSGLQASGASLSENLPASTNIHSEKASESSQKDNVVADAVDAAKAASVFNSTDFEPVSPTPLPDTPGQDNDGFIEGMSRDSTKWNFSGLNLSYQI
jgi:hypothetical protein